LIEAEMKVGQKGQIVIPRAMRKALKIEPGSKVSFRLEEHNLILKKSTFYAVGVFKKTSQQINCNKKTGPHQYEEELEERNP
jgi:AbrB family looped-hinge helix DNA binding protein